MPILRITALHKTFPEPGGRGRIRLFENINMEVGAGQSLAIMGRSGSGKTTLLHLIAGLETPDAGTIQVGGQDLASLGVERRALLRAQTIGLVFQLHHLFPQCTALENVLLPAWAAGAPAPGRQAGARARDLLAKVGLADRASHRLAELSGGERQRVAIARALINRPAILLADEPTGSLDDTSAAQVLKLLLDLGRQENLALVMATHATELAGQLQRRLQIAGGKLRSGTPESGMPDQPDR